MFDAGLLLSSSFNGLRFRDRSLLARDQGFVGTQDITLHVVTMQSGALGRHHLEIGHDGNVRRCANLVWGRSTVAAARRSSHLGLTRAPELTLVRTIEPSRNTLHRMQMREIEPR